MSRSAVNKRVIQLESSLGVRLLHRTMRQVSFSLNLVRSRMITSPKPLLAAKAEDAATSQ
ncbi:LysR family transcriptional regulator [Vibrio lentus]|nr:LysR family transcriptional regulator [Vibrio lentus]